MTDERKPKIENLELKKETLQDLTETEAEGAQGGALGGAVDATGGHLVPTSLKGGSVC